MIHPLNGESENAMQSIGLTNRGHVRDQNEDELFFSDNPVGPLPNLYIVADGMGGYNAGEVASRNCTKYVVEFISRAAETHEVEQLFYAAIDYANQKVYQEGHEDENLQGMGTTVVICTVADGLIHVANVGDSRLYALGEQLNQITIDHSVVEELYRAGHITEVEKRHHPDRNMITRAMGVQGSVEAECFTVKAEGIHQILLCTDGLTKMMTDLEIEGLLTKGTSLETTVTALIRTALDNGGIDNVTVVLADLLGGVTS